LNESRRILADGAIERGRLNRIVGASDSDSVLAQAGEFSGD
jgi:hypothetical protein